MVIGRGILAVIIFTLFIFSIYILIFLKFIFSKKLDFYSDEIKISIVIAAKNEEKNIPTLISALKNQNYPVNNYEVIIIDDNSTDNTFELTNELIDNLPNFKITKATNKIYKAKKGALQFGIEKSNFNYLLITDADCNPQSDWLRSYSNKFSKGYNFLFGVAPFYQSHILVNKIAAFENLWTHILTFSFANIGLPYSATARSFGFDKMSFLKLEGYKNITNTLSGDDDLLIQEAYKAKFKIGVVTNKNSFVFSYSKTSLREYLNQKARHVSTSKYYNLVSKTLLLVWHLLNILFLFSIFIIPLKSIFSILFLVKIFADIFLVKTSMKYFSYKFNVVEIIYLQVLYELLLIVNYLRGRLTKINWK